MVGNYKKKGEKGKLNEEDRIEAMKGVNELRMTVYRAAKHYKITRDTLCSRVTTQHWFQIQLFITLSFHKPCSNVESSTSSFNMSEQTNNTEAESLVWQLPEQCDSNLGLQHHEPEAVNIQGPPTVETTISSIKQWFNKQFPAAPKCFRSPPFVHTNANSPSANKTPWNRNWRKLDNWGGYWTSKVSWSREERKRIKEERKSQRERETRIKQKQETKSAGSTNTKENTTTVQDKSDTTYLDTHSLGTSTNISHTVRVYRKHLLSLWPLLIEGEYWVECRSCLLCYHLACVVDDEEDVSEYDFVCPSCM